MHKLTPACEFAIICCAQASQWTDVTSQNGHQSVDFVLRSKVSGWGGEVWHWCWVNCRLKAEKATDCQLELPVFIIVLKQ